jgi:hypothetical protein
MSEDDNPIDGVQVLSEVLNNAMDTYLKAHPQPPLVIIPALIGLLAQTILLAPPHVRKILANSTAGTLRDAVEALSPGGRLHAAFEKAKAGEPAAGGETPQGRES